MKRRRLLRTLGVGGFAGVAGCLGGGGGGGGGSDPVETTTERTATPTATATPTPTETTTTVGPVDRSIAGARADLLSVARDLSPSPTPTESQQSMAAFRADELDDMIAAARTSLDEAAGDDPSDDQLGRIERLRAIADFLSSYVEFLVVVREATRAFGNATGQVDAGVYDDAKSMLETADARLGTARDMLGSLDSKATTVGRYYDPGEDIFGGELRNLMNESAEWDARFEVFESLVAAEIGLVTALRSYHDGVSDYASENYGAAADNFSTAEDAATRAERNFRVAVQSSLVMDFGIDPGARACRADKTAAAAARYGEAATAAGEGRSGDAAEAQSAAQDAFDREC